MIAVIAVIALIAWIAGFGEFSNEITTILPYINLNSKTTA